MAKRSQKTPEFETALAELEALVEKMGGHIGFDSVVHQGTTFYVDLPMHIPKGERLRDEKWCVSSKSCTPA